MLESPPSDGELAKLDVPPSVFFQRLQITTYSLLLVVLLLYFLREFRSILQPLCIGLFLGYLILPAYKWIVARGVRPVLAGITLFVLITLALVGLGSLVYRNVDFLILQLPHYQERGRLLYEDLLDDLPVEMRQRIDNFVATSLGHFDQSERLQAAIRTTVGNFFNFFTALIVTFVYLAFLMAERGSFPRRIHAAFGPAAGDHILAVVGKVNDAISQYLAVKTFVSVLAGFLSYVVLVAFGIDFAAMWAILIFLLNFIPYLGSLVAVALPILLSIVQLDSVAAVVVLALLLTSIQQVIGTLVEPRLAGHRLGVSPLLILLSLAFWGLVWGIVGMILAVPLLMVGKIVLDNIQATRPLATLMSHM